LLQFEGATQNSPARDFNMPVECALDKSPFRENYIRDKEVISGDLRLYDKGNLYIATEGMQAASVNIGSLWVTYNLEFLVPKFQNILADYAKYNFSGIGPTTGTSLLFNAAVASSDNTMTFTFVNSVMSFDPRMDSGTYLLEYYCVGTAQTIDGIDWTANNCTILQNDQTNGTAATKFMFTLLVQVTDKSATLTAATFVVPSTSTGYMKITKVMS